MKFNTRLNASVGKLFMMAMMVLAFVGCGRPSMIIKPYSTNYQKSNYKGQRVLIGKAAVSSEVTRLLHFKTYEYRPPKFDPNYLRELLQKELLKYEIQSVWKSNYPNLKIPVINMSLNCWEGEKGDFDIAKDYVRICEVTLSAFSPTGELIYAVPQKDFYYDTSKFIKYSRPKLGKNYESSVADRKTLVKNLVIKSVEKFNSGYGLDY